MKISHKLTIILIAGSFVLIIIGNLLFAFFFSIFLVNQETKQMSINLNNLTSYLHEKELKYQMTALRLGDIGTIPMNSANQVILNM